MAASLATPRGSIAARMDAIVFDWDGTLIDSLAPLYAANVAVLASYGITLERGDYLRAYRPDWRAMYRRLGIPADRLDEAGRRWTRFYGSGAGATPFPGVPEALRRLADRGYRMGLVTAGDRPVVTEQARRFGLDDLLPVRVHADDLPVTKPHPEPLRVALDGLGVRDPARAIFVGDVPDDMRMAVAAGATPVGIVGSFPPRVLRRAGATSVHRSVVDWVDAFLDGAG